MTQDAGLLKKQVRHLSKLLNCMNAAQAIEGKIALLEQENAVCEMLADSSSPLNKLIKKLHRRLRYLIYVVFAIGQGKTVFRGFSNEKESIEKLRTLLDDLEEIEHFYKEQGGLLGYHLKVLSLMLASLEEEKKEDLNEEYFCPPAIPLNPVSPDILKAIRTGIESLESCSELYPIGGAGDRLDLKSEASSEPLPAAFLPFNGRSLLEEMIRDVQAREYLFFKCFGKQLTIPIAMMTSPEKDNHLRILKLFKEKNWFYRSKKSFYFFLQPSVPVISAEGKWAIEKAFSPVLKPSGHGVIWKLAEEMEIFDWFQKQGKKFCLLRQINNPLAGTDFALLALLGYGAKEKKTFGFLSCERRSNSPEGANVLLKTKKGKKFGYTITNIEYTDFKKRGIQEKAGSLQSDFPANTNILFANLAKIREVAKRHPIPGLMINMKSKITVVEEDGKKKDVLGGRLECTMQNIADHLTDYFDAPIDKELQKSKLSTFLLYNQRQKTLSTTKTLYRGEGDFQLTPEQAFYDQQTNHYHLLKECAFKMPFWPSIEEYTKRPLSVISLHPGLGPLYSVITQKVKRGFLKEGSELCLEVAELELLDLHLEGSLIISTLNPLGRFKGKNQLVYGRESCCSLRNVTVKNEGIDFENASDYWKLSYKRKQSAVIFLHPGAECDAESVTLEGECYFEVPTGYKLILRENKQEMVKITKPSWSWHYHFDQQDQLILKKS